MKLQRSEKVGIAVSILVILTILFLIVGIFIGIYSTDTAKDFCKDKDMVFYDLQHGDFFDTEDNVICYIVVDDEMKFYYYRRE